MNSRILKYICIAILLSSACTIDNATSAANNQSTEPCDCTKTFEELVDKLEANYVGLALITDTTRLAKYRSLKNEYTLQSKNITADACTQFLDDFLSFFQDGHLSSFEYPKADSLTRTNTQQFLQSETRQLDAIKALAQDTSDPIIGLWTDGESIFSMVKNQSYFDAYIVKSNNPDAIIGSLKLRITKTANDYRGTYYPYSFNARYVKGNIYKESQFLRMGTVKWEKVLSETSALIDPKAPRIQKIDEENTLLTIPSFSYDYKEFQSFLKENKKQIKETTHLIIDIRGNTGGNAIYFPLIGNFATQTITSTPGYVLTSDDNRAYFERFIGFGSSKVYSPLVERMSENGKVVEGPHYADKEFGKAKNNIERVSILMDNGSASASESFILHAKGASTKVLTFGSPSRGMIDFTSVNSLLLKNSGNQNIYFGYPTGTLHKDVMESGYNQTGILPDNPIPADENKIQYIIDYYK